MVPDDVEGLDRSVRRLQGVPCAPSSPSGPGGGKAGTVHGRRLDTEVKLVQTYSRYLLASPHKSSSRALRLSPCKR